VFFLGLSLLFVVNVLLRPENFLVCGLDHRAHQFFLKTFLAESFRAGELPLWMPYICAGRPFAADPQSGVFYPFNLIYAVLSIAQALPVLVILHIAAAGFFCCLLGRELKLSWFGAVLSGVIFMFNGFLVTRGYRGQSERLEAIAYLPLLFFLIERAERSGRLRWYAWAGLAGALQLLAGAPQIAWLSWVGLGVYVLVRQVGCWKQGGARALVRSMGGVLLALAFTAGVAGIQIIPTAELVSHSNRSAGSITFAGAFAFEPQRVIHFFFPNYFIDPNIKHFNNMAESSGYVSVLGLTLALVGLLRHRSRIRWALLAVMVLNVFIMLGQATPVFDLLYHTLPGLSAFRIPSRAIMMLTLCLSVLAGLGADAIWHDADRERARKLAVAAGAAVLAAMCSMAYYLARYPRVDFWDIPSLWTALALAVLSVGVLLGAYLRQRRGVQVTWLALICLDLFVVGAGMDRYRQLEKQAYEPRGMERDILRVLQEDPSLCRFALPRELVRENSGVLVHKSSINGFISLSLDRYYKFVHYMTWRRVPDRFTHSPDAGVIHPDNKFPFKVLNVGYYVGRDRRTGAWRMVSRDDYVPRAFFVTKMKVLESEEAVLEAMRSPQFEPRKVLLFDRDPGVALAPSTAEPENRVTVTHYSPRSITIRAEVGSDGFLVLSEMDYPGWRAYVEGREVPILRADYLIRAIPLKAGRYDRIEFRYEPRSFTAGLVVSLGSVALLVVCLVLGRGAKPSAPQAEPWATPEAAARTGTDKRRGVVAWVQISAVLLAGLGLPLLLRSDYAYCWARIGHMYARRGEYERAAVSLGEALRLEPDLYYAHYAMGTALAKQGKLAEAAEHALWAAKTVPDDAISQNNMGGLFVRIEDVDRAVRYFRRSLELDPEQSEVHYNWGLAVGQRGRFDEAAEHFAQALRIDPGNPRLYDQIANHWAAHGEFPRALVVLRKALQQWPDSPEFLDSLAWILAACPRKELRDGAEAVNLAMHACRETAGADPKKLFTLAAALAEDGQLDRAIEVARRAQPLAVERGDRKLTRRLEGMLKEFTHRRGNALPGGKAP
jgi:tetratricopeptide (TPR) repeat protein